MAARSADELPDEDELDPVEAADEAVDDEGFDLAETDLDEDPDAELDDEVELDEDPELGEDPELESAAALPDEDLPEDDDDPDDLLLPSFDDEDDEDVVRVVVDDDEDDDPDADGLRAGEFVCRSCYMAKRESALADPKRMLCRDCA